MDNNSKTFTIHNSVMNGQLLGLFKQCRPAFIAEFDALGSININSVEPGTYVSVLAGSWALDSGEFEQLGENNTIFPPSVSQVYPNDTNVSLVKVENSLLQFGKLKIAIIKCSDLSLKAKRDIRWGEKGDFIPGSQFALGEDWELVVLSLNGQTISQQVIPAPSAILNGIEQDLEIDQDLVRVVGIVVDPAGLKDVYGGQVVYEFPVNGQTNYWLPGYKFVTKYGDKNYNGA